MKRVIATLSALSMAGGVAIACFALLHIHCSSIAHAQQFLPAASKNWAAQNAVPSLQTIRPKDGEFIGTISIPSINKTVNIFEGTSTKVLAEGGGHYEKSVLPGLSDNSILAGHRDTVFRNLGKVKVGDSVTIVEKLGTFTYLVKKIRIVDKNDRTVIVSTKVPTLTLSTCYPFIYFGNAPKRYVVIATLSKSL